jgi:hypothetical protein
MIEQTAAMQVLLDACPSFADTWCAHRDEYGDDLLYLAAGDFARHLLRLQETQATSEFVSTGRAIERLHVEGNPWVREFATIGILEGIQNVWSHSAIDPDVFFPFLGVESQRWWKGLNAFWQGEVPNVRAVD